LPKLWKPFRKIVSAARLCAVGGREAWFFEMKLSHKVRKLTQSLTYERAWRRVQRVIFPLPLEPLLASVDRQRLREIKQRYAGLSLEYAKYADIERWLPMNRERVQDLKLHRLAPKRVLDLGCGGGFFLFILKRSGHSVLGLDMDQFPLFTELLGLFDVPRVVWTIKAFEPLPDLGQKFDWITAFSINFNLHYPGERLWGCAEWDFLLRDLQGRLAPSGKIFFALNPTLGRDYYTSDLRDFFLSRGATVERERIFFRRGLRF